MIRALIVDDEPIARAGLRKLLETEADVSVVGECRDGAEAVARIRSERPDLVFLDVQMPELTGFEVLSALVPAELPAIVFVTAYDAYALDAFEASAVDYLLKPFDRERFARALSRARRFLAGDQLAAFRSRIASVLQAVSGDVGSASRQVPSPVTERDASDAVAAPSGERTRNGETRLMIRSRGRIAFVALSDIEWIETSRNYARVRAKGVWHTVREPLTAFANRLDDRLHFRRNELVFRLRRKLRIGHLDGEYARQTFARIVAGKRDFFLFRKAAFFRIFIDDTCQRTAKAREMRAAVALRNVVREAQHRLVVAVVPPQSDLDIDAVPLAADHDRIRQGRRLRTVEIAHEGRGAALVHELFALDVGVTRIGQKNFRAGVQKRQLAKPMLERRIIKFHDIVKRLGARQE